MPSVEAPMGHQAAEGHIETTGGLCPVGEQALVFGVSYNQPMGVLTWVHLFLTDRVLLPLGNGNFEISLAGKF